MTTRVIIKGGAGSGHFGHAGRPGKVGGSLPGVGRIQVPGSFGPVDKYVYVAIPKHLRYNKRREELGKRAGRLLVAVQDYGVDIDKVEIVGSFASDKSNPGDIDLLVYTPSKTDAADTWNTNQVFEQNQDLWKKIYPDIDLIVIWPEEQSWADDIKGHEDAVEVMRIKGGAGSGFRGHRGRPGKVGGSLPRGSGIGVASLTNTDRKVLIQGVKSVGEELWSGTGSGFVWDDDNPFIGEMTPAAALAEWEDVGTLEEATHGDSVYTGIDLVDEYGYSVSIDLSTGNAVPFKGIQGYVETFVWKDVNDFYRDNPGKLLVNHNAAGHSITIFKPQSYDPDARDIAMVRSWYDQWGEHEATKEYTIAKGGAGSGFRGHAGRPGKVGGSLPEGLDLTGFDVIESNIIIPSDIPDDWLIFNAYRPIAGTLKASGGGTTWIDHKAPNGKHLAAVDPNDSLRDMWLKANKRDQAVLLTFVGVSEVDKQLIIANISKGGAGSGFRGHRGRPGKVGGSLPRGSGGSTAKVWQGEQQAKSEEKLSKLQTGAIGEELAMRALEEKLGAKFSTLNNGVNNAPIDVGGNGHAVEVKTGLASNGRTAQHWRATIGQPGKKETELIKRMSKEEKRAYHSWKKQKILERKNTTLREMEKVANTEIKPATVGVIMSPDGKRGDVYLVPGFHLRLPWKDYATDEYHIGTYDVDEFKEYLKGGAGSGFRGHRGRPGKVGGSLPRGSGGLGGRITPQNDDEKALLEYLTMVSDMRKTQKPGGYKYSGMEEMVLKEGRFFIPPKKGDALPKGCKRGDMKECFKNSLDNMLSGDEGLVYTEGYATNKALSGFGFQHAWLTTPDGKVIDPTWSAGEGTSYFGIRMSKSFVLRTALDTEMSGILVNDWMHGSKLMKDGFPKGALEKEYDDV